MFCGSRCIRYFKDTNFEANYNEYCWRVYLNLGVFDISKILISKQITTLNSLFIIKLWCIRYFKDTNFEANYNCPLYKHLSLPGVFDISKILISKQITTSDREYNIIKRCIRYFKDTNFEANYNYFQQ